VEVGGLGAQQGAGEQVRSLGAEVEQQGRALDEQVRALADAQQVAVGDQLAAADAANLTQLRSQSGPAFDAAWLRVVSAQAHSTPSGEDR
jgi:predicted outer membrane protein